MRIMTAYVVILLTFLGGHPAAGQLPPPEARPPADASVVVDNFESYNDGAWPDRWKFFTSTNEIRSLDEFMAEKEKFFIVEEDGNTFLRAYTEAEAQRISIANEEAFGLDWNLDIHPVLAWDWRAHHLPAGAAEDDVNDTGAAVYITFSRDWLGRPRSIKYTYSSTLPVGTVVSFGRLKVIVASNGANGIGEWVHIERNVADDYRRVFGKAPPERPLSITLWSDSDDTKDRAEVDFDNIKLRPSP